MNSSLFAQEKSFDEKEVNSPTKYEANIDPILNKRQRITRLGPSGGSQHQRISSQGDVRMENEEETKNEEEDKKEEERFITNTDLPEIFIPCYHKIHKICFGFSLFRVFGGREL